MPPPPPALLNGSPEPRYRRDNSDSPPPEPPPPPPPDDDTNQRGDQTNHNATDGAALSGGLSDLAIGDVQIEYSNYCSELQMPEIMQLIQRDLSEPYSIYTYRYFINNWPNLCFLARHRGRIVGAIVCKLDSHDSHTKRVVTSRGYIAMLAVDQRYRKQRIGSRLVLNAIRAMAADAADEVVLETEVTNTGALRLYENLGFVRDKRLFRYYLNGVDALRLKLWLWPP